MKEPGIYVWVVDDPARSGSFLSVRELNFAQATDVDRELQSGAYTNNLIVQVRSRVPIEILVSNIHFHMPIRQRLDFMCASVVL